MKIFQITWIFIFTLTLSHAKPIADFIDWLEDGDFEFDSDESDDLGNPWEKSGEFEGDIIVGADDAIRNGLVSDESYWPNKTLIYKIDTETFDAEQIDLIHSAVEEFHKKTCIQMKERKHHENDFIFITGDGANGCSSHVGRQGGKQPLYLKPNEPGKGCFKKGTVIHELLHALGFYHQQSAPERDEYVEILWDNIQPGREHNFKKYDHYSVTNFNVTYDYQSIMHYSAYAFSKNDEKTIMPREKGAKIGQRKTLSKKDIIKLHQMYKCKENTEKPEEIGSAQGPDRDTDDTDDLETILD